MDEYYARDYDNIRKNFDVNLFYITAEFEDEEIVFFTKITHKTSKYTINDKETLRSYIFICPVLHSSDGEVRTFGCNDKILNHQELVFQYKMSKSESGISLINKFVEANWTFYNYTEAMYDTFSSTKERLYNKERINNIENDEWSMSYYSLINKIVLFYLYVKYIYEDDMSNIEHKDSRFIKYIENTINITKDELKDCLFMYDEYFYTPCMISIYTAEVLKITPTKYDIEWNINKFITDSDFYSTKERMFIQLPGYEYFKYYINVDTFYVGEKLLFKLKFKSTKILYANVYIGNNVGKPIYQNLLDIKNNITKNIIKFEPIDYYNLIIMNILNLRFLHMCGCIHNDLHLNNILFRKEVEIVQYQYRLAAVYDLQFFNKYYLHLGKMDFNIIDFGRACYITDKDIILNRIKKFNKDFYVKYLHRMNELFEQDLKMTGYLLSMFDYIEYINSIYIGYKWINDNNVDFDKLQDIISYCYEIIESYLTNNNKKLTAKIVKILSVNHYKYMPELLLEFIGETSNMGLVDMCDKFLPDDNMHPIDLVIAKFYPDNIYNPDKHSPQVIYYKPYAND